MSGIPVMRATPDVQRSCWVVRACRQKASRPTQMFARSDARAKALPVPLRLRLRLLDRRIALEVVRHGAAAFAAP